MKHVRVHTSIFSHTPKAIYVAGGVIMGAGASDVGVGKVGKLNRGRFNIDVDWLLAYEPTPHKSVDYRP
jgi:hypothetical protein